MTQAFQTAKRLLKSLDREELEDLQALIEARLEDLAAEEAAEEKARAKAEKAATAGVDVDAKAKGYIELKMIPDGDKTYGPYAYLRWWDGKTLRSKYMGKAKTKGAK